MQKVCSSVLAGGTWSNRQQQTLHPASMASFSDLFKLGKEILKAETFVLHEAETRGADEGMYGGVVLAR